ncbi:putative DNA-binding domain-containing protein [Chitinophaga oryzae]|uniref:DNA-binding domain-containing protein n=1 Tax=Chitinophaga oryzae TaxID=2725414 RepID=A0AAE6ZC33_9BACT|nr:putative DNA-binding domain-containing protein [Chitinophaga oryzae]QJB29794.1 putative DNA-binding domain-containing protein [Chitinophaga oryzae]
MNSLPDSRQLQQRFTTHLRTGVRTTIPGVAPDRLAHYRHAIFHMVKDTMESAYPVTCANIPRRKWDHMVKIFFARHACTANQVWKLPLEFYAYAVENNWDEVYDIPYLSDLLAFEWAEIEVFNMEDAEPAAFVATGDWRETPLVLNPEYRLLSFRYPVHQEAKRRRLLKQQGAWFVLLHREPGTGHVQFTGLSPWLAFVTEQLAAGITVKDILEYAPQLGITVTVELETDTVAFLRDMHQRQFVLGFQP